MPPSLHGVSWAQFPRFGGTLRHADSSPPIPPRFVAFARRYHPSTCGFAPSDARCDVHGLGLGEPVPAPRRSLRWRRRGLPGSRETHPHACHALRPRRGRPPPRPLTMRRDNLHVHDPHDVGTSQTMHVRGLQSRGLRAPCRAGLRALGVTPSPTHALGPPALVHADLTTTMPIGVPTGLSEQAL